QIPTARSKHQKSKSWPQVFEPWNLLFEICHRRDAGAPASGFRRFGLQGVLRYCYQFLECSAVRCREVGDDFPIERYFGGFQSFDKPAVRDSSGAGGGVDSNLPERAEISFFGAAIAKSILPAMIDGIGGIPVEFRTPHPEAFGGPNHSSPSFAGS